MEASQVRRHRVASELAAILLATAAAFYPVGRSESREGDETVVSPSSVSEPREGDEAVASPSSAGPVEEDLSTGGEGGAPDILQLCQVCDDTTEEGGADRPVEGHESSWKLTEAHGSARKLAEAHGSSRKLAEAHGSSEGSRAVPEAHLSQGMAVTHGEPGSSVVTHAVELLQRLNNRKRVRRFGSAESHARFCQHLWRRARSSGCRHTWRPVVHFKCRGGRNLATEAEFAAQRKLARECLAWYAQYSYMFRRLRSGALNTVIHGMVGGGGAAEGTRRMGGCSIGIDTADMPSYRKRFGDASFVCDDALDRSLLGDLFRKHNPVGAMYSPPCKPYSTGNLEGGTPRDKALIEQTRDVLEEMGCFYSIENVLGAVPAGWPRTLPC